MNEARRAEKRWKREHRQKAAADIHERIARLAYVATRDPGIYPNFQNPGVSGPKKEKQPGIKPCECGRPISGTKKKCLGCSKVKKGDSELAKA